MGSQFLSQFSKQVVGVAKYPQIRLIEICLKDAVGAVEEALHAAMQNLISAAKVVAGAWAGFQKTATEMNDLDHVGIRLGFLGNTFNYLDSGRWKVSYQI